MEGGGWSSPALKFCNIHHLMNVALKLFLPIATLCLVLVACGGSVPPLAVADQPTLVFIYTDG
jgi:hypothetical protein